MKPILFNTEMVRAILEGRKTVTRRVVKDMDIINGWDCEADGTPIAYIDQATGDSYPPTMPCPHHPGDILWVRETWAKSMAGTFMYRADDKAIMVERWRPSIHMPKEAARLFLRVTDVRVERLQDITAEGALDEGANVEFPEPKPPYISLAYTEMRLKPAARQSFANLWNSTIKPADRTICGWEANPWVWVIEFERISKDEALGGGGDAN